MMDKFDDPPQPLYSLVMDSTPCIFPCYIFVDNERQYNSARTFEIITMPSHLVHSALKETSLFTVLKAYILFISKDNCIISSDLYFHYWEDNLHFHRSIYIYNEIQDTYGAPPPTRCRSLWTLVRCDPSFSASHSHAFSSWTMV